LGTFTEILELKDKYGVEYLNEIAEILSIFNQEDELDSRRR